jgi:phosphohistidine phosphatase
LAGDGDPAARAALNSGFPASGLAVIRFPGGLKDAAPGSGFLEAFLTPGDH